MDNKGRLRFSGRWKGPGERRPRDDLVFTGLPESDAGEAVLNNKEKDMKNDMKVTFETITPDMAEKYLSNNEFNRKINKRKIEEYCSLIRDGHWETTHQGIMLGKDDCLIDGQNRLSAVVRTGIPITIMVTRDPKLENPLDLPIDRASARAPNFIYGVDKRLWSESVIISAMISNYTIGTDTLSKLSEITNIQIRNLSNQVFRYSERLSRTNRALFSKTIIRVAAILAMTNANNRVDANHVSEQYKLIVNNDQIGMSMTVLSFSKRIQEISIQKRSTNVYSDVELMVLAHKAFTNTRNASSNNLREYRRYFDNLRIIAKKEFGTIDDYR